MGRHKEGVVAGVVEPDISQLERKGEEWVPLFPSPHSYQGSCLAGDCVGRPKPVLQD